jgi:hypothetical protein
VNDAFVMDAWGKSVGAGDKVLMLADGNGQFAKALGVELDLADKGLGTRSRRYALLADDQVRGCCCCCCCPRRFEIVARSFELCIVDLSSFLT